MSAAVHAHLLLDDMAEAMSVALDVVEDRGTMRAWPALLDACADDSQRMALVLGLALLSDGEDFVDAAAATLPPEKTAELCAAYLAAGGVHPNAVSTGVLAATLKGQEGLGLVVAEHGAIVPEEIRHKLAAHVRDAGQAAVADRLESVGVGV